MKYKELLNEKLKQSVFPEAFRLWIDGKLYIDNSGNYRIVGSVGKSGKIAPFNKELKKKYKSVKELHDAAMEWKSMGFK